MTSTRHREGVDSRDLFRAGVRDMAPLALGFVPFAFVIGAAVADSAIDDVAGWAGSFLIAAGSAQLAVVEMADNGAGPVAIIVTAMMINARLAVYGAGLAPWFAAETPRSRRLLAYFVVDPTYLISVARFERDDPGPAGRRWYFLGAATILFTFWTAAQTIAVLVGNRIPESIQLESAAPILIAGMLASSIRTASARTATIVGGSVAVLGAGLPWSSATLLAILAGCVVGARPDRSEP